MRGWQSRVAVAAVVAIMGACGGEPGVPAASEAAVSTARSSISPSATTGAASPTVVASPLTLEVPPPVPLVPLQSLDLADVWVFIPTPDGIWTVTEPGDALVLRDRDTGDEVRRIEGEAPFHATALAFGSAWSTDYDGDALHRYDLETGDHTTIEVGAGPDAILATEDAVWFADHAGDSVERLDPATLDVRRIRVRGMVGRGGPGGMVVTGGSLWLTVPLLDPSAGTRPPGLLVEIDTATSRVLRTMEVDMIPCGIDAAGDLVLVDACGDVAPAIAWLAPDEAQPIVVPLSGPTLIGGFIAGRVWLLQDGRLVAVDPDDGLRALDARMLGGPIIGLIADGDDLWLTLEDRVVRVAVSDFGA